MGIRAIYTVHETGRERAVDQQEHDTRAAAEVQRKEWVDAFGEDGDYEIRETVIVVRYMVARADCDRYLGFGGRILAPSADRDIPVGLCVVESPIEHADSWQAPHLESGGKLLSAVRGDLVGTVALACSLGSALRTERNA